MTTEGRVTKFLRGCVWVAVVVVASCAKKVPMTQAAPPPPPAAAAAAAVAPVPGLGHPGDNAEPGCSDHLWKHVYNPNRLTVYDPCITVTGVLVDATNGKRKDGVRKEADGDTHGWLKVDPQFTNLLNAGNKSDEGGNLVFEIVCYWKPSQQDAKSSCPSSYHNGVTLPKVGTHVAISGTYVQDENHAHWREIHPVSKIVVQH